MREETPDSQGLWCRGELCSRGVRSRQSGIPRAPLWLQVGEWLEQAAGRIVWRLAGGLRREGWRKSPRPFGVKAVGAAVRRRQGRIKADCQVSGPNRTQV